MADDPRLAAIVDAYRRCRDEFARKWPDSPAWLELYRLLEEAVREEERAKS